ncbi:MAG TPA: hypothetical protein VLH41_10980, partial [Thermoanaerobaculia bacterium]|nr:hypothetical protein [Thermoanaerobaculia bacterium]
KITFTAFRTDGTVMGTAVVGAPSLARVQQSAFTLIPVSEADREQTNFYITFTSDFPVFVYAVTVDNKTGDGIYIDAASAP